MRPTFKTRLLAVVLAPTFGLALATHSFATEGERKQPTQNTTAQGASAQPQAQGQKAQGKQAEGRNVRASKLIGTDIRNPQGEDLGKIEDLIADANSGRVHYAIIAFGGVFGFGEKLFAYPLTAFRPSMTSDELVLDIDRERLNNAPGFERNRWPLWGRDTYHSDVDRYFGYRSDEGGQGDRNLLRISELIDQDLEDAGGRDIGEIEDVVVNMAQGRVPFVVVEFESGWGNDDRLHPMPLRMLTFSGENNSRVMFTTSSKDFDWGRGFDSDRWPDLNDPHYRRTMDTDMDGTATRGSAAASRTQQGQPGAGAAPATTGSGTGPGSTTR